MTDSHTHPRSDELHIFVVPADPEQRCELKVIPNNIRAMDQLVGGYLGIVRQPIHLDCGCLLVMAVNEEGVLRDLPPNPRATKYYPFSVITGDVFFVGEGLVPNEEGLPEPDFFSLHQSFNTWEGPGTPLPLQKHPWEQVD